MSTVTVRARVEVEIFVGVWGDEISMAGIKNQVKGKALQKLRNVISKNDREGDVRIVGEPSITLVVAAEKSA